MKTLLLLGLLFAFLGVLAWPGTRSIPQTTDVVLVGAGDIADGFGFDLPGAFATTALLDANPTAYVFAVGDHTYGRATDADFMRAYDPTWGRAKARTIPVIGHHDYDSLNAAGYFNYFGPVAGNPTQGWYSTDLGALHIVALNSICPNVGCGSGGAQDAFLRADLAAHMQQPCTLALFHEPLFTSSSEITPNTDIRPLFQDLHDFHADLIVNGHAHNYERFAPQDANGALDLANGIIEIVAGTGGDSHFPFNATLAPNSLVRNADTFGVLKVTVHGSTTPPSFDWQFVPVAGSTFTDLGTQTCHPKV